MGKAPRAGRVKTRLTPPLSRGEAAGLYACLLADTGLEMSSLEGVRRYLFLDPPEGLDPAIASCFRGFERFPQRGKGLGGRMLHAAGVAFRGGAKRVAIVGADCPALPSSRVREALRELRDGAGAAFGPSTDGGFHLVALASADPRPFRGVAWGTSAVLTSVAARLRETGTPFSFLPPESDVDTWGDLLALREWARTHALPACPRTRGWVRGFFGPAGGGSPGSPERTHGPPRGSRSRRGG